MSALEARLKDLQKLETYLASDDPREQISVYDDMPYAIFPYPPEDEFAFRRELTLLQTRLEQKGKRVARISLAECLIEAIGSRRPLEDWYGIERDAGVEDTIQTITNVLGERAELVELIAKRLPTSSDPHRDVVFIWRTGALYPVYRAFSLLEQLKRRVTAPMILFYPGDLDGPAGLRFMGVLDAEHNYRPKIF